MSCYKLSRFYGCPLPHNHARDALVLSGMKLGLSFQVDMSCKDALTQHLAGGHRPNISFVPEQETTQQFTAKWLCSPKRTKQPSPKTYCLKENGCCNGVFILCTVKTRKSNPKHGARGSAHSREKLRFRFRTSSRSGRFRPHGYDSSKIFVCFKYPSRRRKPGLNFGRIKAEGTSWNKNAQSWRWTELL